MSWVLDYSESKLADRLVLLAIANHCDRYGRDSWPLHTTIAAEAHVSVREVVRAIQALTELGELSVEKGAGEIGKNRYTLSKFADSQSAKLSLENPPPSDKCGMFQVTNATRNKEEPSLTVLSTISPPSSEDITSPKKKVKLTDPRYTEFVEILSKGYKQRGWEFSFNGADGKQLKNLLRDRPQWDAKIFRKCLANYFRSDKVVPGDMPHVYLTRLPRYLHGPLNEFGKLITAPVQMAEDTTYYA